MKRPPKIDFENPDQVREIYAHVLMQKPLQPPVKLAYRALNRFYEPQISYDDGAQSDLARVQLDGNPHIYVYNHQNQDYLTVGAILHDVAPDDVGRIRTLANDQTYKKPLLRPIAQAWGAIPVARRIDYEDNLESVRKEKSEVAKKTYTTLYACCIELLHANYPLGIYVEGGVNKHEPFLYPTYVDEAKHGAAIIGVHSATTELPSAITVIGHTNGPGNLHKPKRGSVAAHVGRTIFVNPENKVRDVTHQIRGALQHCVTVASATR